MQAKSDNANLPLWELPPYQPGSDTSRGAAIAVAHRTATDKQRILNWLLSRGAMGGTYCEISNALGIPQQTVTARLNSLRTRDCVIRKDGKRQSDLGRNATVYVAGGDA